LNRQKKSFVRHLLAKFDNLTACFRAFDMDKSGGISVEEFDRGRNLDSSLRTWTPAISQIGYCRGCFVLRENLKCIRNICYNFIENDNRVFLYQRNEIH
jgi:hypothetical protein